MPRYLLSVYGPAGPTQFGNYPSRDETPQAFADTGAFNEMLRREGHLVFADGLEQATTATTVDGHLALAAEGSRACHGKVEVRPFRTEGSVEALLEW